MAVRFDAASERISRTGAMPANFTITAWVYLSVDRNDYSCWCRVWTEAVATVGTWSTDSDGTSGPNWYTASGSISQTTGFVAGEWRRLAITRTSTGSAVAYAATPDGPVEVDAGTVSTATPAGITLGGRDPFDTAEWWNGRVAHVRVWDGILSQAQIEAEWASPTPVITSGLWADWPLETADDLTDHSGNGRHLSAGSTTASTEDGPPLAVTVTGELDTALPLPQVAISADVVDPAAVAVELPLPEVTIAATVAMTGELTATLPLPAVEAAAAVVDPGTLQVTLPLPEVAITAGAPSLTGSLQATLPLPELAITADATVPGTLDVVLPLPVVRITTERPVGGLRALGVVDATGPSATQVVDRSGLRAVLV